MSHTILYSADELRELLRSTSPRLSGDDADPARAAFVSVLPDRQNLETLLATPVITAVLPLRPESLGADLADRARALDRVVLSHDQSIILAGHDHAGEKKRFELYHSRERWGVIDAFGEFAKTMNCFSDFPEICRTTASELITNAFYNAPRDPLGHPLETDRRVPVEVRHPITVRFGEDETHVWIEVRDPFGTFQREALLNSLLRSADGEGIGVNMEHGGAGIGLYMIFRWAAQLMFRFEPTRATTVLVKLLKTKRHKVFDSQRAIFEIVQMPAPKS